MYCFFYCDYFEILFSFCCFFVFKWLRFKRYSEYSLMNMTSFLKDVIK